MQQTAECTYTLLGRDLLCFQYPGEYWENADYSYPESTYLVVLWATVDFSQFSNTVSPCLTQSSINCLVKREK